jgi:hypothetical protein
VEAEDKNLASVRRLTSKDSRALNGGMSVAYRQEALRGDLHPGTGGGDITKKNSE